MRQTKTISLLLLVVTVLLLGIAYAAIANLPFGVTGNATATPSADNFKVVFGKVGTSDTPTFQPGIGSSSGINVSFSTPSDQRATMEVRGLKKVGDSVTAIFKVINESTDLEATLTSVKASGTNQYFSVTAKSTDITILAKQKTNIEVTVTLIKTPVTSDVMANISVDFSAVPVEVGTASTSPYFTITDGQGNTFRYNFEAGQNWAEYADGTVFIVSHMPGVDIVEWLWNGTWKMVELISNPGQNWLDSNEFIIHGAGYKAVLNNSLLRPLANTTNNIFMP